VSSPEALADFLHTTGFFFHKPGLFDGEVLLDQGWALEAIYTLLHRDRAIRKLRQQQGRFTREDLGDWIWDDAGHSEKDQERFLEMMLGCGICFGTRRLDGAQEYAAPDHLPGLEAFRQMNPNIDLPDPATATASVRLRLPFMHDGLLRTLLARIGTVGENAPDYWKYGCYFREQKSSARVRFDSVGPDDAGAGCITFSGWGEQARPILERLVAEAERLTPGQRPQPEWHGLAVHPDAESPAAAGLEALRIEDRRVFVSYPWGGDDDAGRRHEAFVDRLCAALESWGFDVIRDRQRMRPGDSIRQFMERGARAPRVVLLLNQKYLQSEFCVYELDEVRRCCHRDRDFAERIVPITLPGASIFTLEQRLDAMDFWRARVERLQPRAHLLRGHDHDLFERMRDWSLNLQDVLSHVAGMLHPAGYEAAEQGDFALVRRMLER
jgi:internalin A